MSGRAKLPSKPAIRTIGAGSAALPRKPIQRRPQLAALAPAEDPIDETKYPGDPEGDCREELEQVQAGFRGRMQQEAARFKVATDSSFYFCVVFDSGDQASAFLAAVGMNKPGSDVVHIDGRALADRLGVEIPAADLPVLKSKVDPRLAKLVRKHGE